MKNSAFITLVLRKLGNVGADEAVSPEDYSDAKALIDGSMDAMRANGLLWWAVKVVDVPFTSATGVRPVDCAVCVYASWNGEPVRLIERLEYERIQDKTEAGDPIYLLDDGTDLTVWRVPGSGNLRLTYMREILAGGAGDEFDCPRALVRPFIDYMAFDLRGFYPPSQERAPYIEADAMRAALAIRSLSRETAEPGPVEAEYF